ncbi:hypothetical protein WEU32_06775 [Brevundimonas sp. BH3]|uniref:hypothetical protein n=1 Tax=Brevundimonas sp. BH3 TaxID=3133089 RepID=UPI00325118DD
MNTDDTIRLIIARPDYFAELDNPSETIQLAAVQIEPHNLAYISDPSFEVSMTAILCNAWAIQHIKDPAPDLQLAAVEMDPRTIGCIADPCLEAQFTAVEMNGYVVDYLDDPPVAVAARAARWFALPAHCCFPLLGLPPRVKHLAEQYRFASGWYAF